MTCRLAPPFCTRWAVLEELMRTFDGRDSFQVWRRIASQCPAQHNAIDFGLAQIGRSFLPVEGSLHLRLLELGVIGALTYIALMFVFGRQFLDTLVGMARVVLVKDGGT